MRTVPRNSWRIDYNRADGNTYFTFRDKTGTHTHVANVDEDSKKYVFRSRGITLLLAVNTSLPYIVMAAYSDEYQYGEIFLQGHAVAQVLGQNGEYLQPITIAKRLCEIRDVR